MIKLKFKQLGGVRNATKTATTIQQMEVLVVVFDPASKQKEKLIYRILFHIVFN